MESFEKKSMLQEMSKDSIAKYQNHLRMNSKRSKLQEAKEKLKMKMLEIENQYTEILLELDLIYKKAQESAEPLVNEANKTVFFKKFIRVNQILEECSNKLFLIQLSFSNNLAESDSDCNDDKDSDNSICQTGLLPAVVQHNCSSDFISTIRTHHLSTIATKNSDISPDLRNSSKDQNSGSWMKTKSIHETVTKESQGKIIIDLKCTEKIHRGLDSQSLQSGPKSNLKVKEMSDENSNSDISCLTSFIDLPNEIVSSSDPESDNKMSPNINTVVDSERNSINQLPEVLTISSASDKLDKEIPSNDDICHPTKDQSIQNTPSVNVTNLDQSIKKMKIIKNIPSDLSSEKNTLQTVAIINNLHVNDISASANQELKSENYDSKETVKLPAHSNVTVFEKMASLSSDRGETQNLPINQLHFKSNSEENKSEVLNKVVSFESFPYLHPSEDDFLDVIITELKSPSDFWVHFVDPNLELLVSKMHKFYTKGEGTELITEPKIGLPCSTIFSIDNLWYRAEIIEVFNMDGTDKSSDCYVKVFYVDYGNSEVLPLSKIRALNKHFMSFSRHAAHCSLARICPNSDLKTWNSKETSTLSEIVTNQALLAKFKQIENSHDFEIELYQVNKNGSLKNISDYFVEEGLAKYVNKTNINNPSILVESLSIPECRNQINSQKVLPSELQNSKVNTISSILPTSDKTDLKNIIDNPLTFSLPIFNKLPCESHLHADKENLSPSQNCTCNTEDSLVFHCRVHDWPDTPEILNNLVSENNHPLTSKFIKVETKNNVTAVVDSNCVIKKLAKRKILDNFRFTMSYIYNPGEFYIHIIDSKYEILDHLKDDLNDFYNKCFEDPKYKFNQLPPVGLICCAKYSTDKEWYRARITDIELDANDKRAAMAKLKICYIDYGNSEIKIVSEIRVLDPIFFDFPNQAVCCCLAAVEPKQVSDPSLSNWPLTAVEQFITLTGFETSFEGVIFKESNRQIENDSDKIKLFIIDIKENKKVIINEILVTMGLARMHLPKSSDQNKESEDLTSEWNPMADNYHDVQNTYITSRDDTEIKNNSAQPELSINLPKEGSWVGIEVTVVVNPLWFYAILPFGTGCLKMLQNTGSQKTVSYQKNEILDDLIEKMTAFYSSVVHVSKSPTLPHSGEIIAAQFSGNHKWYRGKVLEVDTAVAQIQVLYIDYGNIEWINHSSTRILLPQFMHLPMQAITCRLANVEILSSSKNEAKTLFEKVVDGKILVAHILLIDFDNSLQINLYDTTEGETLINQQLIDAGFARSNARVEQKRLMQKKHDISMYPG